MSKQTTDIVTRKRKARAEAQAKLNALHAEELRTLMEEAHEAYGVEYQPRLSEEERARLQVLDLLAKHPKVVSRVIEDLAEISE